MLYSTWRQWNNVIFEAWSDTVKTWCWTCWCRRHICCWNTWYKVGFKVQRVQMLQQFTLIFLHKNKEILKKIRHANKCYRLLRQILTNRATLSTCTNKDTKTVISSRRHWLHIEDLLLPIKHIHSPRPWIYITNAECIFSCWEKTNVSKKMWPATQKTLFHKLKG